MAPLAGEHWHAKFGLKSRLQSQSGKRNPAGAGFSSILQDYRIKPYRLHTSVP
jgi:hypothetical protein